MRFYTDLHVHSKYSRATSRDLDLEHLAMWAQIKGIGVIGTGDCVHPAWLKEIKQKLEPAEDGFFRLKKEYTKIFERELPAACRAEVRFMLTVEISNIYKRLDKVRKVHNCIFLPSFEAADKLQKELGRIGNIASDGRPILGLDSRDLLEITLKTDPLSYLIPAHIWTPWFSALGSKSGFDKMTDCFGDLSDEIFAVETGLSSDPPMNWRLSQLDNYALVSNSDAHSPAKVAREATIYDTEFSYRGIYNALRSEDNKGLVGTVEFFPEEGKYHYDGLRSLKLCMHPRETIANNGCCPDTGKPVTIGVLHRVEELADHPEGRKSPKWRPFYSLIPLPEIIGDAKGVGPKTKTVNTVYFDMLNRLGNELYILMEAPLDEIKAAAGPLIAEGIRRMRDKKVRIESGYDGEYGIIKIFTPEEREVHEDQLTFFG